MIVTYCELSDAPYVLNGAVVNKDDLDDVYDLSQLFDEGPGAMVQDAANEDPDEEMAGFVVVEDDSIDKIGLYFPVNSDSTSNTGGRILTWQVVKNESDTTSTTYQSLSKVHPGQDIRFVGNPTPSATPGKKKKLESVTVEYYKKDAVNGTAIPTSIIVLANDDGFFTFTVPDDVTTTGDHANQINVTACTFTEVTDEDGNGPAHNQTTGSLVLAIVLNKGNATIESSRIRTEAELRDPLSPASQIVYNHYLELGPTVIAGGKLDLYGCEETNSTSLADGRAVVEKRPGTDDAKDEGEDEPIETAVVKWTVPGADFALKASSTLTGTIEGKTTKDQGQNATSSHPEFTYKLPTGQGADDTAITATYNAGEKKITLADGRIIDLEKSRIIISYYTKFNVGLSTGKMTTDEYSMTEQSDTAGFDTVSISADGTITFKPSLGTKAIKEGTTVDVSFIFVDTDGNVMTDAGQGASTYAIANPVNIRYNALTDDDSPSIVNISAGIKYIGSVKYNKQETHDGKTTYYFEVDPDHADVSAGEGSVSEKIKGYILKQNTTQSGADVYSDTNVLYASWVGADGQIHKQALKQESGQAFSGTNPNSTVWSFTADSTVGQYAIPAGATITINAVFTPDKRDVKVNWGETSEQIEENQKQGTVEIKKTKAMTGDTVEVVMESKDPEKLGVIGVTARVYGAKEGDVNYAAKTYYPDQNGKIKVTVPEYTSDSQYLIITPVFAERNITVVTDGDLIPSTEKVFYGEKITLNLNEDHLRQGHKISDLRYSIDGGNTWIEIVPDSDGRIAIPNQATFGNNTTIKFDATPIERSYDISNCKVETEHGKIEAELGRADKGDEVILKVTPKPGYRAKYGTVRVTIGSGTNVKKITATWVKDNTYKFKFDWEGTENPMISLDGEFEEGEDGIARSLGTALALSVVKTANNAEIKGGQISAETGVALETRSSGKASTEAMAGYSKAKQGIAGAVAFQVAVGKTRSIIHKSDLTDFTEEDYEQLKNKENLQVTDTSKTLVENVSGGMPLLADGENGSVPFNRYDYLHIGGGQLYLNAKTGQTYNVKADAANKKKAQAASLGVGAGIAVGIDARDTIAEVEDGIQLDRYDVYQPTTLSGISISASQNVKDTINAVAGALGGTSFVPVAAIDVYNTDVRAKLGRFDFASGRNNIDAKGPNYQMTETEKRILDDTLTIGGAVKIKASGKSTIRTVTADASSRGGSSAKGAAFIITWISNDVDAILNQSLHALSDISVTSLGSETLKAVATAAATGGAKGSSGSSDKQANNMLGAAGNIAGKVGAADSGKIKEDIAGRQLAETGESSVAGAGAFVLNIMKNYSNAEIKDNVNIHTTGKLAVTSQNRTDATIKANASTAKSDKGVGVAVALNIVFMDNYAKIGNGKITANELEVSAKIAQGIAESRTYSTIENSAKFKSQLEETIGSALKNIMGEKVYNTIGSAITAFASTFAQKLIDDLNLSQVFQAMNNGIGDTFMNFLKIFKKKAVEFPKTLLAPYKTIFEQFEKTVTGWDKERVWNTFEDIWTSAIVQTLGDGMDTARSVLQRSLMSLVGAPLDMVTDGLNGKGWDFSTITKQLEAAAKEVLSETYRKIIDNTIKRLSQEFPVITESNISLIKQMKDTSLEDLKKNVIPYFTKIFRDNVYDYEPVATKIRESGGIKDYLKSEIKTLLATSAAAMTNEMIEGIVGQLNVKFSREPVADRHIITTQAISGSSAKNSTTSGAVSVAWVNLDTKAEIADGEKPITVTGNMDVEAEELRRIRTHATASVNSRDGEDDPDNNDGAGETEDDDVGGDDAGTTSVVKTIKHKISVEDFEILEKEKLEKDEDEDDEESIIKLDDDDDEELLKDEHRIDPDELITIEKYEKEEAEREKWVKEFFGDDGDNSFFRKSESENDLTDIQNDNILADLNNPLTDIFGDDDLDLRMSAGRGLKASGMKDSADSPDSTDKKEGSVPLLRDGGGMPSELEADYRYNDFDTCRMNLGKGVAGEFAEAEDSDEIVFYIKPGYQMKETAPSYEDNPPSDMEKIHITRQYKKADKTVCTDTITAYKDEKGQYHCNFREGISVEDKIYLMDHEQLISLDIQIDDLVDDDEALMLLKEVELEKDLEWLNKLCGDNNIEEEEQEQGIDILDPDEMDQLDKETVINLEDIKVSKAGENGMPKDMQEIKVKAVEGFAVYGFTIVTNDNKEHFFHPEFEKDDDWEGMVLASSNENEVNYGIKVPKEGIKEVKVAYERISLVDDDGNVEKDGGEKSRKVASSAVKAAKSSGGKTVGMGGSFALTWGDSDVTARIGNRNATAGTISLQAGSDHEEENFSTAGTDPYEGVDIKDKGTDVSIAFNMLDNHVNAEVAEGALIKTTATGDATEASGETGDTEEDEEDDEHEQNDIEIGKTAGALIIRSHETSENETKASAFATGSTSAIGASVAVNVSKSDIRTDMAGEAEVAGDAYIRSYSRSMDRTWAYASAMGADIQRLINKFAEATDSLEKAADKLADGTTYDDLAKNNDRSKNTATSNRMADRLNDKDVQQDGGEGGEAAGNMAVSSNVMRSQNAKIDGADDMDDDDEEADKKGSGKAAELIAEKAGLKEKVMDKKGSGTKKQQLAATIGVTVALHNAAVKVGGTVKAGGDISITSQNAGNFNTRSSSFSMTLADMNKGSSIAAAFGISVNNNKSTIDIGAQAEPAKDDKPAVPEKVANLISTNGDVTVDADLTQNMTGSYRGWLAVQSLSGAVSGTGADKTFAGAFSVVVSHATTRAALNNAMTIEGDNVAIHANDKTKLAARAGGISISKGTNTGMGASVVTIWAGNDVEASVNKDLSKKTTIKANSFDMRAQKERVDYSDFKFPLSMSTLITDSSELTDEQRENVYTGFIDVHKEPGKQSYSIDINIDSYALMQAADALNFLSSNNYYAESIAGSVTGKSSNGGMDSTNRAGSFSIVRASNRINAILGNNITIERKDADSSEYGPVNVVAQGDTTARILAGSMAAGSAASTAGLTVTFLYDRDNIDATIGKNFKVINGGNVNLKARGKTEVENYNGAAGISATDQETGKTFGGAVNMMIMETTTDLLMGAGADIDAKGKLNIGAKTDMDLKLVSVSASAALGKGTSTGGTVSFINDLAKSRVIMGANHNLKANDDVNITAETNDFLLSINGSASGASKGRSLAGSINILHAGTEASVIGGSGNGQILSRGGSVTVKGHTDTKAINVTATGAISGYDKAIGLSINLNFFDRTSNVDLKGGTEYRVEAKKDILISARGNDTTGMGALAIAGGSDFMLAGNVAAVVSENKVKTRIGTGKVKAGGEIAISSHLRDLTVAVAGAVSVSLRSDAMGATYMLVHKENTVTTDLGAALIHAEGAAGTLAAKVPGLKKDAFKGLYTGATVNDSIVAVAVGVAAGFKGGVNANVLNINNINKVNVKGKAATLKARSKDGLGEGSVIVRAKNDSSVLQFSGGVSASAGLAAGAAATTLYSEKNVRATVNNVEADRNVEIEANNHEKITALNINVGGGKDAAVEVGISFQLLESRVLALAYGDVRAETGSVRLHSHNDTDFVNATVAAAGSGQTAVSPVIIVTVYAGSSEAQMFGANVYARNNVDVIATANKDMDTFAIGAGASNVAVSGAVTVTTVKDVTKAVISKDVKDLKAENMSILAQSDYDLFGLSATVTGANKAAIAINTILSFVNASTLAEMEGTAVLHGGTATVAASSHRDVLNLGATLSGALLGAGVGITVSGLSAGAKMDQDAADMVVYGKLNKKDDGEEQNNGTRAAAEEEMTFDEAGFRADLDNRLQGTRNEGFSRTLEERKDKDGKVIYTSLASDMQGNKNYVSETDAGKDGEFDASSGTVSEEYYEERQKADKTDTDGKNEDDTRYMHDRNENMGYGQEHEFSETGDVAATRELGHSVYDDVPGDSVIARIGADASITGYGVEVLATQGTEVDIIGGTVAHGGIAGAGAGSAFALLHSNVSASSMGTLNVMDNEINVQAYSVAGSVDSAADSTIRESRSANLTDTYGAENRYSESDRNNAVNGGIRSGNRTDSSKALGDNTPTMDAEEKDDNAQNDVTVNQRSLRVIGLAVADGFISGAAAISVLRTDNVTQAEAGGKMSNVGSLKVGAHADYNDLLAVTIGGAMGQGGAVAASVGVITAEGTVDARINSTANVSGKGAKVDVYSEGNVHGMSFAATAAVGGFYTGAAGAAVVANRLDQNASIDRGAKLIMSDRNQPGSVNVHSKSDTSAASYLIGISSGTFNAAGLGVAVAIVKPKVYSTIGVNGKEGMTTLGNVGDVSITNVVDSEADTGLLSVSVAQVGASLSGNVLIVLNNTEAVAKAANSIGAMRTLTIKGDLSAEGDSKFLALQVGMAAAGASVSYVDVSSKNKAVLDLDAFTATISDKLTVATGKDTNRKTKAVALSIAAAIGKASTKMINVAIALNKAENSSIISGKAALNAPAVELTALSNATARTRMYGLSLTEGLNIAGSVSVAVNKGTSVGDFSGG